ncbi:DegT/DnrJ/EryC1/StrS aminotransferase family protein [Geobacter sp. DSM 9736]|uniref:DegT/DnrJ/EryC1/StrS family aminotransferase n=1 Tax=Geobacter sp. DSM 9736 TaxID=1277350 RepID=UPI000B50F4B0|nr:DegT/DnrJ/EryC1/StrS family aminotransferase [Geobacter sp. DSM 9736]SNB46140.1 dTDP-4-amino-4,6-dideoxygalactose transaminase [Geobacter sp. DSM 9736]
MNIPFLDLKAQYQTISREINDAMQQVITACAFSGGKYVSQFEDEFASFCGCGASIGVGSGTEALWLALLGLGIGPGDEVITVPNTFIATVEAISLCGADPVFVDVDEQSYTMNPQLIEAAITPRTKAVIPVHLFGQPADMDPIMAIARKHGLYVIEDACQAHGAAYKGKVAGTIGDAGCFSFYPGKNLGAYGEAGGVVTGDPQLADRIKMLRDHGQSQKYYHNVVGVNSRMDGIQGAVLSVKLKYLDAWNEKRRAHAKRYCALLQGVEEVVLPREMEYVRHVFHIFAVRVKDRESFMQALTAKGIGCGIHYPVPVHLQEAYSSLQLGKGSFPVAERHGEEFVSLPLFPEMEASQVEYVAETIKDYFAARDCRKIA